uniref:nuclear transport factor 2 family protein n=1 Tax=Lentzea alba TaxID=2714351 RepID=UPI0039BF6472
MADRLDRRRGVGDRPRPDHVHTGIDAICAAVQQQWQAFPLMQHGTVNHVVDLGPDGATGRSDMIVHVQIEAGWITGGGTYVDRYRVEGGKWRIARRTVVRPFDLGPLPEWAPSDDR